MKINLNPICNFNEVFNDTEVVKDSMSGITQPKKKIGHIRAYHDNYRWNTTYFPCHEDLKTEIIKNEFSEVCRKIIESNVFKNINAIKEFCHKYPSAGVNNEWDSSEYNFYIESELCNYWVRFITRQGDYNLYLHAFIK